ncbi:MAG TPA: TraM recognition domain-containing protein, partial [Clostridia bacterium]|nr:TraM recognition domain-containing protein [Clostridia bacterium]
NLVSLCRTLLRISAPHQGASTNEEFWRSTGDQLLGATFDLFLLAGVEITFDRLVEFINEAPTKPWSDVDGLPQDSTFAAVLEMAKAGVRSQEDGRILQRALDYWQITYTGLADKTRTSITAGIIAMLDTFRGRGVTDLVSSETNITPESILSGKIVVLDLPIKEMEQTGLLVQSAWKYIFQKALERQGGAGELTRRPVFLWEDEGQFFFSEHDHHFQATARSSRVAHVVLSQNLHNFYQQFGSGAHEIANSIFGNLNTKIFHANSDPTTNEWAARQFGTEVRMKFGFSTSPPARSQGFWGAMRDAIEPPPGNNSVSFQEHREYAIQPEEFARLRKGGRANDFQVDALITWLGLSTQDGKHSIGTTFNQNPKL